VWSLFRAELEYHRRLLAIVILLGMPAAAAYNAAMDATTIREILHFLPFVIALSLASVMSQARNRERRDRLLFLLPLAAHQVALSRLVMTTGPFALALLVYAAVREVIQPESSSSALVQISVGLCLSVTAIPNICRDLFHARARLASRVRMLVAGGMLAALVGVSAYVAMTPGQPHPVLARIFTAHLDGLRSPHGPTWFLLLSLVIGFLSVVTYSRRRSFLQT